MKRKLLLSILMGIVISSLALAKAPGSQDTIYVTGGTLSGAENAGSLETAINGDVDGSGNRLNPNRVYALYEGQVYFQLAPIQVNNPTGTLTIVGVPDPKNASAKTKPIILISPTNGQPVALTGGTVNAVYGSLKFVNIHYQVMQLDGSLQNELFFCGTANKLRQSLTIDNCLFEFANIDLFDCTNESSAIGGWPYGSTFKITNSYFRNLFHSAQWWASRIFQCKFPIDTIWVENNTIHTGGLTFLQQNNLADFVYVNHNTIVNNHKYWMLSPYRHNEYITNNIFINQDWVGEDTNVTMSGQDPDKIFMSTISIDTNNITNGLTTQTKYWKNGDSTMFTSDLDLNKIRVYVSNNVNYYDPKLISGYYQSSTYTMSSIGGALPSYLTWFTPAASSPLPIGNVPGAWMNSRTKALFTQYAPPNGGFVEKNTITSDPGLPKLTDAMVTAMAQWNQSQWSDSRFSTFTDPSTTAYINGDFLPTTLPGISNGTKTDGITASGSGIQVGITKFTDLQENYASTLTSTIDGLPLGSLIWNDAQNASYSSSAEVVKVLAQYVADGGLPLEVKTLKTTPSDYSLGNNYPNPFNPTTTIHFTLLKTGHVNLTIYNMLGQKVRTLVDNEISAGTQSVVWDGKDNAGNVVPSGIYLYQMNAGTFTASKKMMLLK